MKHAVRIITTAVAVLCMTGVSYAYSNNRMIDDSIYDNDESMTENQIRTFINSRPNTCLTINASGYGGGARFAEPIDYWNYGSDVDAARVVFRAAQYNDLNPQVILTTLQKEQSLLTDNDCRDPNGNASLPKAMGYACFEGSSQCPESWAAGFSKQVMKAAWQLKFDKERSYGHLSWGGNGDVPYRGRMTKGVRKRCQPTCNDPNPSLWEDVSYDGYSVIDGVSTYIENGATAALYNYTPHRNQSFPSIFESYFGSALVVPSTGPGKIYRLHNEKLNDHLLTISPNERDKATSLNGYDYEGAAFIGYFNQQTVNLVPIYRSFNPHGGFHFYTKSLNERSVVAKQGYANEGIGFYAFFEPGTGRKPVYRLLHKGTGKHFFTSSTSERARLDMNGWTVEGVAWYVE